MKQELRGENWTYIAVTAVVSETIISRFNHTIHDLPEEVQIVGSNDHCTLVLPQSFLQGASSLT